MIEKQNVEDNEDTDYQMLFETEVTKTSAFEISELQKNNLLETFFGIISQQR